MLYIVRKRQPTTSARAEVVQPEEEYQGNSNARCDRKHVVEARDVELVRPAGDASTLVA